MRCLIKAAAALLSSTLTSALVIPDPAALTIPPSNPIVEYRPSEAQLKFVINTADPKSGYPTLTFRVEGTEGACGDSNILLNDQKLVTKWEGVSAHGREYLDIYGGKEAEWHIRCLHDVTRQNGDSTDGGDIVHILSLQILGEPAHPGFTISYKQLGTPAILRFRPRSNLNGFTTHSTLSNEWRTPSIEFDPDVLEQSQNGASAMPFVSQNNVQATLGAKLDAFKSSLSKGMKKVVGMLCSKKPEHLKKLKDHFGWDISNELDSPNSSDNPDDPDQSTASSNDVLEAIAVPYTEAQHDELTSTVETYDATTTVFNHPAATTRSLSVYQALSTTPASTQVSTPSMHSHPQLHHLKLFFLVLVSSSFLAWLFLRCRDPRRRAESLARKEERRNRKLYRRAALEYRFKQWFWKFRLKYGLAPVAVIEYNEKRSRVRTQEDILEDAMNDDIRTLRNAHRVVSNITAAEEGRNSAPYESTGSERRRSVSTLPGYESEDGQLPTYDELRGSLETSGGADGLRYTSAEYTEFRSDSSVISTSPRISRDGTNSDFDEKVEPYSLADGEVTGLVH